MGQLLVIHRAQFFSRRLHLVQNLVLQLFDDHVIAGAVEIRLLDLGHGHAVVHQRVRQQLVGIGPDVARARVLSRLQKLVIKRIVGFLARRLRLGHLLLRQGDAGLIRLVEQHLAVDELIQNIILEICQPFVGQEIVSIVYGIGLVVVIGVGKLLHRDFPVADPGNHAVVLCGTAGQQRHGGQRQRQHKTDQGRTLHLYITSSG